MAGKHQSILQLCEVANSNAHTDAIRLGAIKGLGYAGNSTARETLLHILKSAAYPDSLRAAAGEALGRASAGD